MKLIKGEFKEKLDLLFAPSIRAGFPSPADDYLSESIDFNRDLIKHPEATFYGVVIYTINKCYGSETIVIGAQQYTQKNGIGRAEVFANAIKHNFRSKNPTTRWSDIIKLK